MDECVRRKLEHQHQLEPRFRAGSREDCADIASCDRFLHNRNRYGRRSDPDRRLVRHEWWSIDHQWHEHLQESRTERRHPHPGGSHGGGSFVNFGLDGGRSLQLGGSSTATTVGGGTDQIDLNATNPNTGVSDAGAGTLTVLSGATFTDQTSTATLNIFATNHGGTDTGLTAAVNNAGTWTKNGGSLTSTISTLFNNTGTVDVETGTLNLTGAVTNTGLLKADGGNLFVAGTIGGGSGEISGSSILEFSGPSNANITFDSGSTGTLKVDGSQGYGGTISGLALGNYVDLTNVQYFGSLYQPQYVANADNTGGTLWVVPSVTSTSGGVAVGYSALLNISGTYSANSFVQSSDGHGGSLITDPPSTSNSLSPAVSNDPTGTWMSEATDAAGPSQSFIVQQ